MKSTQESQVRGAAIPVSLQLLDLVMGSWRAGIVSAFAELGVADAFRAGAVTPTQLAFRLGLERDISDRFCRAAAAVGLMTDAPHGTLELTELGCALATDSPDSMRNFARWSGSTAERATWAHLPMAVRTGRSPFAAVHGSGVWDFLDTHPDTAAVFNAAMTELSRHVIRPVVEAVDFSRYTCVTDVGGGRGALLSEILHRHPHLSGVLLDQPDVLARAPQILVEALAADRVTLVPGSFFDGVPSGSDLFVISNVLHDWDDAHARAILCNIASAMRPGDDLAIVEAVVGVDERFDEAIGLMDMDMLVLCDGKQRSVGDFRSILSELNVEITGVGRAGLQSIIRGTKLH
jgi:hypothetical protein